MPLRQKSCENNAWSNEIGRRIWCSLSAGSTSKGQDSWFQLVSQQGLLVIYISTLKELIRHQPANSHQRKAQAALGRSAGWRDDGQPAAGRELRAGVRPFAPWAWIRHVPSLVIQEEGPLASATWGWGSNPASFFFANFREIGTIMFLRMKYFDRIYLLVVFILEGVLLNLNFLIQDYPGRILEQRLRREPFGLSRYSSVDCYFSLLHFSFNSFKFWK